jgi:outer membrane protein assembly factor BamE (lipoprotein component of BamABCDE complex)
MSRLFIVFAMAVFSLVATGCMSMGHKLDPDKMAQVKKGMTKDDVIALVGPPTEVENDSDGLTVFNYLYLYNTATAATYIPVAGFFLGGGEGGSETFVVEFNKKGLVEKATIKGSVVDVHPGH